MNSKKIKNNSIIIGNRVKSARTLSGYNRKAFAEASGISMATLRAWEEPISSRRGLTIKGALRLANALNKLGIYCTDEWLLHCTGPAPSIINPTNNETFTKKASWGEEEAILQDIESFKTNNPNPIVAVVTDGAMLPYYSYGDYVGGSKCFGSQIKELVGSSCIVETGDQILVRKIITASDNKYTLSTINQGPTVASPILVNVKLNFAAEIIWHRWRKRIKNDVTQKS